MRLTKFTAVLAVLVACNEDTRKESSEDIGTSDAGEEFTCYQRGQGEIEPQPVAPEKICDGVMDCFKGQDEDDCPDHFVCPDKFGDLNLKIVSNDKRCDDFVDCGGTAEDEEDCGRDFQLLCAGYDYISLVLKDQICDGNIDCYYGDDEKGCPDTHFCQTFGQVGPSAVIEPAQVCDGKWDCEDDEFNCKGIETFTCGLDQGTIPLANKCDQESQCADGSDELGCTR